MTISVPDTTVSLSALLSAFSYALDITEGQPEGHCIRVCWIGIHIGREVGLGEEELWELYYMLLLKDLGCSSNAARICELYLTDDLAFKRNHKILDSSVTGALNFVFSHTGIKADLAKRFRALSKVFSNGKKIARELIETRCYRGADIARQLQFSEPVARGIACLDEHWDGSGYPEGLGGDDIPLYARIALLAQVVDVFYTSGDRKAAKQEALNRSGAWFDPRLVSAFMRVSRKVEFWQGLCAPDLQQRIFDLEPASRRVEVDEDYLDAIALAFGQVVDAKSPYTSGHSTRVAQYAELMAAYLGMDKPARRRLRRGALLHDVGKLGVSNMILDKPGKLDDQEWQQMRDHALHTETILSRISVFGDMAFKAAAHHERLDGAGYPHGIKDQEISLETRIITVADFFDALTADRPYRKAMAVEKAIDIIESEIGSAVDPRCVAALQAVIGPMETFHQRFQTGVQENSDENDHSARKAG